MRGIMCIGKWGDGMRISEFKRQLKKQGIKLLRHGSRHDIYINPADGKTSELPRHDQKEIGTGLKNSILNDLGLK